MPDWDEDSERLRQNLVRAFRLSRDSARSRQDLSSELAREWHSIVMQELDVPDKAFVGRFRGEDGLTGIEVYVGTRLAARSDDVASDLKQFDTTLARAVNALDGLVPPGRPPDTADTLNAIIELTAWVHAEWVRIHPFVNGNGRTARLWAAFVAMRYGLPPFVRLRPRPDGGYGDACGKAMDGDSLPLVRVFRQMYLETMRDLSS
jgi:fido (protein-threonine AMPylation protein)